MRKSIYASLLGFIGAFAFIPNAQCVATEREEPYIHEMTIFAKSQDLYFDNDEMMVVVGERSFPVSGLQRSGNQWKVQIISSGYCQMGHNLCRNCNLCHLSHCIYYVRPCNLWD